jgi:pantothenate kinase type III
MNLVIEIGNTTSKFAVFEMNNLIELVRFLNNEIDLSILEKYAFKNAILSGSGKIDPTILDKIKAENKLIFENSMINNLIVKFLNVLIP